MSSVQLTRNQILALVSEANRAPSVHNVQPARFGFTTDDQGNLTVLLYSDQNRRLLAGDPLRHDEGTSLGAAWEGLRIALARQGLMLELLEWLDPGLSPAHPIYADLKQVATGKIFTLPESARATGASSDDLAEFVFKRKAYRGKFKPAIPSQIHGLVESLDAKASLVLNEPSEIKDIARLAGGATSRLSKHLATQIELLQWLRFTPSDKGYYEDGLNAEAMGFPKSVALIAKSALHLSTKPGIFKTGLTGVLIDETPAIKSSSAILILFAPLGADAATRGRILYRSWLEVTRAGLSACPMSVLADDPQTQAALSEMKTSSEPMQVLTVFRIGVSPEPVLPLTVRLQPEKLVTIS
ncbi:MAG: hypothetical protein JST80_10770 [Bdellovibrionales bacterium]|nr:hypothetical protein [Bdellovibrionales bacterium]